VSTYAGDGTTDDLTITDSAGNTWTRTETGNTYDAPNGIAGSIYYAQITLGGGTKPTVTANFFTNSGHGTPKSVTYRTIEVAEFSGVATSSPLDKHGTNLQSGIGDGSDLIFCPAGTVTPTTDGQLIFGFTNQTAGGLGNSAFLTAGTLYTQLSKVATVSPSGYFSASEYKVQSTAAAVQATWTQTGTGPNPSTLLNLMATFKAASAASANKVGSFLAMFQ
jgi:hypothetical protein